MFFSGIHKFITQIKIPLNKVFIKTLTTNSKIILNSSPYQNIIIKGNSQKSSRISGMLFEKDVEKSLCELTYNFPNSWLLDEVNLATKLNKFAKINNETKNTGIDFALKLDKTIIFVQVKTGKNKGNIKSSGSFISTVECAKHWSSAFFPDCSYNFFWFSASMPTNTLYSLFIQNNIHLFVDYRWNKYVEKKRISIINFVDYITTRNIFL